MNDFFKDLLKLSCFEFLSSCPYQVVWLKGYTLRFPIPVKRNIVQIQLIELTADVSPQQQQNQRKKKMLRCEVLLSIGSLDFKE